MNQELKLANGDVKKVTCNIIYLCSCPIQRNNLINIVSERPQNDGRSHYNIYENGFLQ